MNFRENCEIDLYTWRKKLKSNCYPILACGVAWLLCGAVWYLG